MPPLAVDLDLMRREMDKRRVDVCMAAAINGVNLHDKTNAYWNFLKQQRCL